MADLADEGKELLGKLKQQGDSILDKFKMVQTEKEIDLSRVVKVAIIGCGWIAEAHVEGYQACPDVQIVAAADLVPGKAEAFCRRYGIKGARIYESDEALIAAEKDLDAVSICTYNTQHAPCAIHALNAGLNVLLEKPFTVTLEEAVAVMKAEKASGKILSIGFQPRLDANMQMIKKIVASGELGEIYYIQTGGGRRRGIPTPFGTSFIDQSTGGIGALGDIGCYSLDLVLNAIGYPRPLTVSGYTSNFFGTNPQYYINEGQPAEYASHFGVDDFAAAFVRLEGGIVLDFRIAWAMHLDTPGDTIIMGKKGALRVPSTECWNGTVDKPMVIYHEIAGEAVETVIPIIQSSGSLFNKKIRSFVDAVKDHLPAPVPSSQILYNQAIIDGINRSARAGRELPIEIPEI